MEGKSCGSALGETEDDGEVDAEGDTEGLALLEGLTLAEGDSDGESDGEGLTEALGLNEALTLLLGEADADGEREGLTLGEPTDDTLRISTIPPTLAEALLSVKEPELMVVMASKVWSAHTTPCESLRSVQPAGVVKVGVASATQVSWTVDFDEVRTICGHVPLVDETFDCAP